MISRHTKRGSGEDQVRANHIAEKKRRRGTGRERKKSDKGRGDFAYFSKINSNRRGQAAMGGPHNFSRRLELLSSRFLVGSCNGRHGSDLPGDLPIWERKWRGGGSTPLVVFCVKFCVPGRRSHTG